MSDWIIVYHDQCHDGITALWVCLQKYPDAEVYPGRHDEPPDLERFADKHVLMVDFAWKRDVLQDLSRHARSLKVLDHHESIRDDLDGLVFAEFDMGRSGAGMAWDYLFPGRPRPWLVDYVEDRDLWRFALLGCREVHAYCNSFPLTIEERQRLMAESVNNRGAFIERGSCILRYHDRLVESAAKHAQRETIGGYNVPSIGCPTIELVSDLGQLLANGEPFAAVWIRRADGSRQVSLRSGPYGMNVARIAALYGGGGHRHAAGFTIGPVTP